MDVAFSPSFDCKRVRQPDEATICSSRNLSDLDRQIVAAYNRALAIVGPRLRIKAAELLEARHTCNSDASCIRDKQVTALRYYDNEAKSTADQPSTQITPSQQATSAPRDTSTKTAIGEPPLTGESCGSGQEISGASEGTHFRGLYINMPRAEVQSLRIPDFTIETALCKATIVSQSNDKKCGEITFGKDARIEQMVFAKCFFGAENLAFEQFSRAIVDSYGIPNLSCRRGGTMLGLEIPPALVEQYEREGVLPLNSRSCSGPAKTGELVSISSGGMLLPDMRVTRTKEKPTFN